MNEMNEKYYTDASPAVSVTRTLCAKPETAYYNTCINWVTWKLYVRRRFSD